MCPREFCGRTRVLAWKSLWETKDLREDLLLLLVWVVTIGELSILQCTVNNTTTNTLIDKQKNKKAAGVLIMNFFLFFFLNNVEREINRRKISIFFDHANEED